MENNTKQMIMDAASATITCCCENTSSGQYFVEWEDIKDYISEENYKKYYEDIIDEISTREEVLDVYETNDMEIDINCCGNWCVDYDEDDEKETLPVYWPKAQD